MSCRIENCSTPGRVKAGLCPKHYMRLLTHGDPHYAGKSRIDRLMEKVEKLTNGCWQWTGYTKKGYGFVRVGADGGRRYTGVHRVVYELLVGKIPGDLTLDHLCRNRACVNPDHLEPVTSAVNTRRGGKSLQTHCKRGHPLSGANLYTWRTSRICRTCRGHRVEL